MNRLQVITEDVPVKPAVGRWRTTTEAVIVIWMYRVIFIASGFKFDGASIPFFLWWWCSPWDWWVVLAACVHDYLYRHKYFTRRECDRIFYHLLCHKARQSRWRWLRLRRINQARIMYAAVRVRGDNAAGAEW
jgi:hypothetical protein